MGERTGVGLVECAILEALDSLGAQPRRGYRRNARVLAAAGDRVGLAPGYAYEVLLDLARPWTMPLSPDRRAGQLRQPRKRSRGEPSLHRVPAVGQPGKSLSRPNARHGAGTHRAYQRQRLRGGHQAAVPPPGGHRCPP